MITQPNYMQLENKELPSHIDHCSPGADLKFALSEPILSKDIEWFDAMLDKVYIPQRGKELILSPHTSVEDHLHKVYTASLTVLALSFVEELAKVTTLDDLLEFRKSNPIFTHMEKRLFALGADPFGESLNREGNYNSAVFLLMCDYVPNEHDESIADDKNVPYTSFAEILHQNYGADCPILALDWALKAEKELVDAIVSITPESGQELSLRAIKLFEDHILPDLTEEQAISLWKRSSMFHNPVFYNSGFYSNETQLNHLLKQIAHKYPTILEPENFPTILISLLSLKGPKLIGWPKDTYIHIKENIEELTKDFPYKNAISTIKDNLDFYISQS